MSSRWGTNIGYLHEKSRQRAREISCTGQLSIPPMCRLTHVRHKPPLFLYIFHQQLFKLPTTLCGLPTTSSPKQDDRPTSQNNDRQQVPRLTPRNPNRMRHLLRRLQPRPRAERGLVMSCGHAFGNRCIKRWLDKELGPYGTCPTCRRPLFKHSRGKRFFYDVQWSVVISAATLVWLALSAIRWMVIGLKNPLPGWDFGVVILFF